MREFSLKKSERLSRKKIIDSLFAEGESFYSFPLKVVFMQTDLPADHPAQAGFTVSKRNFKKAVKRNLLKRKMREAYRLNKSIIYNLDPIKQVAVMFIYSSKEIEDYQTIESGMVKALKKLSRKIVSSQLKG